MKKGWKVERLGDVCEVIAGQSPEGTYYNDKSKGLPFYQGKKEFTEKYLGEPTTWTTKITKEAQAGDVLMSVRAPVGPVNFATQKICIGRGLAAIRASTAIDKEFLFYFLLKHEEEIEGNAGAVFSSINKTQIENISIPLPPLPEQKRIVSLLDECFAALAQVGANAARNQVNAREVFEATLEQDFQRAKSQHELKNITELCEIGDGNHGGNYPKKSDMRKSGVPFIRSVNLIDGHISDGNMRFISKEKHESLNKGHLKTGDVLFTNRGEMGKSAVVDARYNDANLNSQIAFFRCSEQILPWYLYYVLQSPYMQEHSTKSQTGAALQQLPIGIISKFEIPLPPLVEQRRIVQRLDGLARETSRLEEAYRQKVEDVEELRRSVLKEAFQT